MKKLKLTIKRDIILSLAPLVLLIPYALCLDEFNGYNYECFVYPFGFFFLVSAFYLIFWMRLNHPRNPALTLCGTVMILCLLFLLGPYLVELFHNSQLKYLVRRRLQYSYIFIMVYISAFITSIILSKRRLILLGSSIAAASILFNEWVIGFLYLFFGFFWE